MPITRRGMERLIRALEDKLQVKSHETARRATRDSAAASRTSVVGPPHGAWAYKISARCILMTACTITLSLASSFSIAFAQPVLTLNPRAVLPTSPTLASGRGFAANETIKFLFDSTFLVNEGADSQGSFFGVGLAIPSPQLPARILYGHGADQRGAGLADFLVHAAWPVHQSPYHAGYNSTENVLKASNVAMLRVRWKAYLGSITQSSPVVANGRLYVGSLNHKLYAFNASNGKLLWTAETGGPIFSTSAWANNVVYVASGDYYLYALDAATGLELWRSYLGGAGSSPTISDGVIYIGSSIAAAGGSNFMHAIDATTGRELWTLGPSETLLRPSPTRPRFSMTTSISRFTASSYGNTHWKVSWNGLSALAAIHHRPLQVA